MTTSPPTVRCGKCLRVLAERDGGRALDCHPDASVIWGDTPCPGCGAALDGCVCPPPCPTCGASGRVLCMCPPAGWEAPPDPPPAADLEGIAAELAALVQRKSAAYGDSVTRSGEIMRILYPDGIPVTAYRDALLVVRVLDKLSRIATDRDAFGEDPWGDVAGYALRAVELRRRTNTTQGGA